MLDRPPVLNRPALGGTQGLMAGTVAGQQRQQQAAVVPQRRTPAGPSLAMQQLAISQARAPGLRLRVPSPPTSVAAVRAV